MTQQGLGAILISPGADLRYLIDYDAIALERLTCLVLRVGRDPILVVPRLEALAAATSPVVAGGLEVATWGETDDPYAIIADLVRGVQHVGVDNHMWAEKVLRIRDAIEPARLGLAGNVIDTLRMIKDSSEIDSLKAAGAAIDSVHARVPGLLRAGVSERTIGSQIAELILAAGHVAVDFVIVASGPNAASPHHDVSDRLLQDGDCVVVDIGGTMPDGYRSDCTRTYHLGAPTELYAQRYAWLMDAQQRAVEFVRAGVSCESIDSVARDSLADHGIGELFIHRTGHGIGLESHEQPYIVQGNTVEVQPGMAFSIEPGFYDEGLHGARIEDIVIATADGCISVNNQSHDLVIV